MQVIDGIFVLGRASNWIELVELEYGGSDAHQDGGWSKIRTLPFRKIEHFLTS